LTAGRLIHPASAFPSKTGLATAEAIGLAAEPKSNRAIRDSCGWPLCGPQPASADNII
jgi:hypothetical protein